MGIKIAKLVRHLVTMYHLEVIRYFLSLENSNVEDNKCVVNFVLLIWQDHKKLKRVEQKAKLFNKLKK